MKRSFLGSWKSVVSALGVLAGLSASHAAEAREYTLAWTSDAASIPAILFHSLTLGAEAYIDTPGWDRPRDVRYVRRHATVMLHSRTDRQSITCFKRQQAYSCRLNLSASEQHPVILKEGDTEFGTSGRGLVAELFRHVSSYYHQNPEIHSAFVKTKTAGFGNFRGFRMKDSESALQCMVDPDFYETDYECGFALRAELPWNSGGGWDDGLPDLF